MSPVSPNLRTIAAIAITGAALLLATTQPLHAAPAAPATKVITVTEGTDMQVALSPDHRTLLADVQGITFSLPFSGGAGKQISSVLSEINHPSFSPKGDLVAVQSYAGGTFHIWTMHPDGSALKQLTTGHGDDREPRISPDGKTIAFDSDRAFKGSYDIWTADIATGALKQITSADADEFEPNWTPDGSGLVFVSGAGALSTSLEAIDLASGKQHTILSIDPAKGRFDAPSYSPDGTHLAFVQFDGSGIFVDAAHLHVISTTGDHATTYTGKADDAFPFPALWLSNDELVYTANGHILDTSLPHGTEHIIPFSAAITNIRPQYPHKRYDFNATTPRQARGLWAPTLSPDGKQIAFIAINQLYLMPVGGKPVALTHDTFFKQGPAWSPDGKTLAYVSDRDGVENVYLHAMSSSDTSSDKRVAPSETAQIMPAWSPDGKTLAFQDQTGATLTLDIATGKTKPLAPLTFFPGRPAFSASGKTVAIATIKPYTKRFREGTSSILTVDVATGKTQFFAPAPFESVTTRTEDGPVYAPNGKEMAFIMDDLLYTMPVDADGHPSGPAVQLNNETSDAPTWSGDSSHLLYLNDGKLRLIDRASKQITPVSADLTYTPSKPHQKLLIHAQRFWKGRGPDEQRDLDILITDNRITSITPHSATPPPGITRTIEAGDNLVMPGLWENHAHPDSDASIYYGDRMGRLWLAYGITELKGVADNAYRALSHREAYTADAAIGPRLFDTAEAIDGERVYYPMMIPTTSQAQLEREWHRLQDLDFDFMKLYVRLPFSWVASSVQFAHNQMGVQTAGHYLIPEVALGEDGMTHISATSRNGWAYSRSFVGHSYSDAVKLMAESGMWTISTTFSQAPYADYPNMADDPRQAVSPPWENKRLRLSVANAEKTDETVALQHLKDEESTVADIFHAGGLILAGTDSPLDITATSLHLNLRAQVKFGLAPWQALESATFTPARAYGLTDDLGTLAPGHLADLIIVAGDPLKDIADATRVQCVMKNGQLHSVADILAPFAKSDIGSNICPTQ